MADKDGHVALVLEIEKYPCLYNTKLPEYSRKMVTEKAWGEVAKNTQLSVSECKEKWRNIRSTFRRSLKPSRNGVIKKTYYLSRYLNFIIPFSKPMDESLFRDTSPSQDGEDDLENAHTMTVKDESDDFVKEEHDPIPVPSPSECFMPDVQETSRRRRRTSSIDFSVPEASKKVTQSADKVQDDGKHHMKYFFLSLLPEFSNMSEQQTRMFKIKVLQLIDDIKADR